MTAKTLSKAEIRRRRAAISRGEWDHAWVVLSDRREFFVERVRLVSDDPDRVHLFARDRSELATVRLAEIVTVVH